MSDPTQNPPPDEGSSTPSEPTSEQTPGQAPPPRQDSSTPPPPPPPPSQGQGQGSYGTGSAPPPPPTGSQPGAAPPQAHSAMGTVGQPGELLPRFLARLIDFILLAIVEGILSAIVFGIAFGANTGAFTGFGVGTGTTYAWGAVITIVNALITLAYFTIMESRRGQTVGKMLLKLETRGPGGGHPTTEQALRRNAFTAIGILGVIPFLGFVSSLLSLIAVITIAVTIANNSNRHGWHDDFAGGTTVYKIG